MSEGRLLDGNLIINKLSNGKEIVLDSLPNTTIKYYGKTSKIIIHGDMNAFSVANATLFVGENAHIEIGENFRVRFSISVDARANNTIITIGKNANIGTVHILAGDEPQLKLSIGNNFLTSTDCYIRLADGHTIYDITSHKILNMPQSGIHIGDNVWCGYSVSILKDVTIPPNCVIGAGSLVLNGVYEPNSIIAGSPAKVIRTNIMWDSRPIYKIMETSQTTEHY